MRRIAGAARHRHALIVLAAVGACALPGAVNAQASVPGDSAAVVAVVQRLFDAMATRDTAAARALILPGARFASVRSTPPTSPGRFQSDTAFIASLAGSGDRLLERMWNPLVRVQGRIADLWAPYDFHIGPRFSHCGVDVVTLIRTPDGWRISGIAYTVETTGCAPSPLGPPR